ncbi:MAG: DUF4124 domain-containing protein [Caldimonas sp.]
MNRFVATAALVWFGVSCCNAGEIYRWVDDQGRTQLSDTVPDKYRKSAVKVDSRAYEVSPEQRKRADAQAARVKAQARDTGPKAMSPEIPARGGRALAGAASIGGASGAKGADCATLRRVYRESQECFAPFVMANGATNAGAFKTCGPAVPDPSPTCGLATEP